MKHEVVLESLTFRCDETLKKRALKEKIDYVVRDIAVKLKKNIQKFDGRFPAETCVDGKWPLTENTEWTTAFWPGQLWLAWELTGDNEFKDAAESYLPSYKTRVDRKIDVETHDLGFLYTLSCVSAWRLTGNVDARKYALNAADLLLDRYNSTAGIIQAWGDLNDPEQQGRMIIDCNMNLPLLYWASRQTGDPRYQRAAIHHVGQAARYLVRPDASTYHTYYFDVISGKALFGNTHQGFSDTSCWSRGQAWGIYGFLLSYVYTGDKNLIELSRKLAHYFLNRLPEDSVCHWDLDLNRTDAERDSSGAAIAACGLLELSKTLPPVDEYRSFYENAALTIIDSLIENYYSSTEEDCEGLLKESVYHMPSGKGVNECCSWGDYFFMEALMRVRQSWYPYW